MMSIRLKLYMSYLAMAFVPFVLLILVAIFLLLTGDKQDIREFTDRQKNENFNQALIYGELNYVIHHDAEQLEDPIFVNNLQQRLSEQWAGLILTKGGKVTGVSPFLEELSPEEDWLLMAQQPNKEYAFKLYNFTTYVTSFDYPDGSSGSIVLLHRTNAVPIFWHPLALLMGMLLVCITSLILTYYVSRSIIMPIQQLRTAALLIKEGDLTHMLEPTKSCKNKKLNEFEQLAAAFEEMRIRLKHSIDQSLQYEENRKQLLSHISHDLKTPISAIRGYVEGILDGIANTEEKRMKYMHTIYRKAEDMDKLIDELFLFSKLDLQKVAFDFKNIDLPNYMTYVLEEQRFDLEKQNIQLIFTNLSHEGVHVAADPEKLSRVFTNILNNAVKYMNHEDGMATKQIDVKLSCTQEDVLVEIEDNGPGIDDEDLPYIFDRFYRAEQSRNAETGGSGLGLAIVKQIVDGHHGEVWAENRASGGARFIVKLPKIQVSKAVIAHEEHTDY